MVPKLTIDATVARDYLDTTRERHASAVRLFDLFRGSAVEIAVASSGYNLDFHFDPRELSAELRRMVEDEQVKEMPQLSYPGLLVPGANAFPGAGYPALHSAWEAVVESWNGPGRKPGTSDRMHVETHLVVGRDVFVTDDQGLLTMCRRLRQEHQLPIEAMNLSECIDRFGSSSATGRAASEPAVD